MFSLGPHYKQYRSVRRRELAAESQIQRIHFPKLRRRVDPPHPAGEEPGQALARYLGWLAGTKLHFPTPPRWTESGSDRNTLLVLPAALPRPLARPCPWTGPQRPGTPSPGRGEEPGLAGEAAAGAEPPSWPGGRTGRAARRYLSLRLIL